MNSYVRTQHNPALHEFLLERHMVKISKYPKNAKPILARVGYYWQIVPAYEKFEFRTAMIVTVIPK